MKLPEQNILDDVHVKNLIGNADFASAADYLFNSQLNSWGLQKKNYDTLQKVQIKSFWFDDFKLKVQFNPERIKSTSAEVDENSIKNRKCFLCVENLPEEQKGIIITDNFILLCNPYPIFSQHFTICSLKHQPQRISNAFGEFLQLTKLLSPKYCLVYNGPACGASAPDHLHFQAGTSKFLPIENDIQQLNNNFGKIIREDELITASFIDDGLRRIVFIESIDKKKVEETFKVIFNLYEKLSGIKPEPLMNFICNYDLEFGWSVIIFLRSKHRPESFYKDEPQKLLISPAAIDLSGVIVTPREVDYLRLDKTILHQIFNEVSLDKKTFSLLAEKVKAELY